MGGGVVYVRNKKKLNKIKHGLLKSGQTAINVYKNGDKFFQDGVVASFESPTGMLT